jgi:hypothetical protein
MGLRNRSLLYLSALTLLLLAPASPRAETHTASGTITQNGKTISLKATVAVWDPAEKELRIALVPFATTSQDVETIKGSGTLFVAVEKPSPDPGIWQHSPFAGLVIQFEPGTSAISRERVTHYRLIVSWLDRMNFAGTLNRNSQDEVRREFSHISGSLRKGGNVQLSFKGSDSLTEDTFQWDVRVNSTIHLKR